MAIELNYLDASRASLVSATVGTRTIRYDRGEDTPEQFIKRIVFNYSNSPAQTKAKA